MSGCDSDIPCLARAKRYFTLLLGFYFRPAFQTWFRELELAYIRGGTNQIKTPLISDRGEHQRAEESPGGTVIIKYS